MKIHPESGATPTPLTEARPDSTSRLGATLSWWVFLASISLCMTAWAVPPTVDTGESRLPLGVAPILPDDEDTAADDDDDFTTSIRDGGMPETGSTDHLTNRDLRLLHGRSPADTFRLLPGMVVVHPGGEGKSPQFFTRGFDAKYGADVEVRLDGIPLNAPSHIHGNGFVDLAFILPESLQGVDSTNGPFSALQGPFALAGTVDLRLGVPEDRRGAGFSYELGTTNRHRIRMSYAPQDAHPRTLVFAEGVHDDGFGENRAVSRLGFIGALNVSDERNRRIDVTVGASASAFGLPTPVRLGDLDAGDRSVDDVYDPELRGESSRLFGSVRWDGRYGRHAVGTTLYATGRHTQLLENTTGYLLDPVNGDRRAQVEDTFDLGFSTRHGWRVHPVLLLDTGFGVRTILIDQSETHIGRLLEPRGVIRASDGAEVLVDARTSLRITPMDELRVDVGLRVDGAFFSADGMGAAGSARGDAEAVSGGGAVAAVSPRLSVAWYPIPEVGLFTAYGRGARPPELGAFAAGPSAGTGSLAGSVEPEMTVSDSVEIGVRYAPGPWFRLGASSFFTYIDRESVYVPEVLTNLEFGASRRFGFEFEVASAPADWLEFRADLSYVDARFVDGDAPIPGVPWLVASLTALVEHASGVHGALRYVFVAPRELGGGAVSESYSNLNLNLSYTWRVLTIGLGIENLLGLDLVDGEERYASRWDEALSPDDAARSPETHIIAGPPLLVRVLLGVHF